MVIPDLPKGFKDGLGLLTLLNGIASGTCRERGDNLLVREFVEMRGDEVVSTLV